MRKGLFKIPNYEPGEDIALNVPEPELRNIHGVPAKKWASWVSPAKGMFNFLYSSGITNEDAVFACYKFEYGKDKEAIIKAAAWNLAWLAADKISSK